jgi:hypothetical protein
VLCVRWFYEKDALPVGDAHTLVLVGEGDVPRQRMFMLLEGGVTTATPA